VLIWISRGLVPSKQGVRWTCSIMTAWHGCHLGGGVLDEKNSMNDGQCPD
jgi:hypothetical protein